MPYTVVRDDAASTVYDGNVTLTYRLRRNKRQVVMRKSQGFNEWEWITYLRSVFTQFLRESDPKCRRVNVTYAGRKVFMAGTWKDRMEEIAAIFDALAFQACAIKGDCEPFVHD